MVCTSLRAMPVVHVTTQEQPPQKSRFYLYQDLLISAKNRHKITQYICLLLFLSVTNIFLFHFILNVCYRFSHAVLITTFSSFLSLCPGFPVSLSFSVNLLSLNIQVSSPISLLYPKMALKLQKLPTLYHLNPLFSSGNHAIWLCDNSVLPSFFLDLTSLPFLEGKKSCMFKQQLSKKMWEQLYQRRPRSTISFFTLDRQLSVSQSSLARATDKTLSRGYSLATGMKASCPKR